MPANDNHKPADLREADQSTAARMDGHGSGTASAPRVNDGDSEPQNSLNPKLEAGTQVPPVDTNPETGAPATEGAAAEADVSSVVLTRRVMSMTPLEPRTAGNLKGFGFTVTFDEIPVTANCVQIPMLGTVR